MASLIFSLTMGWREIRGAWRHFFYFLVCIALGVGALVAIALFAHDLELSVAKEARSLLGADVELRGSHRLSVSAQGILGEMEARGAHSAHVSELVAMAASGGENAVTQVVELKAVSHGYPFYGQMERTPAAPLQDLLGPHTNSSQGPVFGAIVQPTLLVKMGLTVGERITIGEATFVISGVIRKEPDRIASLFSLGPRVMISQDGLAAAALVKPGSRARERYLLRLSAESLVEPTVTELRARLAADSVRVLSYRDAQPQLRRFLDQLTTYLGLIGLTALFVGGIGVAGTVRAFIAEKRSTIAILKAVGADVQTITQTYLFQAVFLGVLGSLVGIGLGILLERLFPLLLADLLPLAQVPLTFTISPAPILKGLMLGVLTTVLFSAWPLLNIRQLHPAMVFRRDVTETGTHDRHEPGVWRGPGVDRLGLLTAGGIAAGLTGLSLWQAGSVKLGLIFAGALLGALVVLRAAALAVVRLAAHVPVPRTVAVRHALRNLHRPGSQAPIILISVGIAVMVMMAASLLERSLVDQIGASRPVDAPTFFFIDIQPDQEPAFVQLLAREVPDAHASTTPLVRSRLYAIDGKRIERDPDERGKPEREREVDWYFTREYVLTFLEALPKDNAIVKGRWWESGPAGRPLLSVEEEAARHLGLELGSIVEFDIQGTTIAAEVRSIRQVEWGNFSTNFYMILSPGSLEGAPVTYVATARVRPEDELRLQQAVVKRFPNVTAINLGDVMDNLAQVLERLAVAIRAIAVFCILAAAVVMAAALATTRYQRLYESVILKAFGATRGLIARTFAAEYALLGAIAGGLGVGLASVLAWAVVIWVFELSFRLEPAVLTVGWLLTILLTVSVGFLTTYRILKQAPLRVLREE